MGASPTIEMNLASSSDAVQLAAMSRDLLEKGLDWSWTATRVRRSIRCDETSVVVARVGGTIVGFAMMEFGTDESHLNLLAVEPAYRLGGVGRRLVRWLEKSALVAGISVVHLEVRATNPGAVAFYRRLGYETIGRVGNYYCGREDAIRMARDLLPNGPAESS